MSCWDTLAWIWVFQMRQWHLVVWWLYQVWLWRRSRSYLVWDKAEGRTGYPFLRGSSSPPAWRWCHEHHSKLGLAAKETPSSVQTTEIHQSVTTHSSDFQHYSHPPTERRLHTSSLCSNRTWTLCLLSESEPWCKRSMLSRRRSNLSASGSGSPCSVSLGSSSSESVNAVMYLRAQTNREPRNDADRCQWNQTSLVLRKTNRIQKRF